MENSKPRQEEVDYAESLIEEVAVIIKYTLKLIYANKNFLRLLETNSN